MSPASDRDPVERTGPAHDAVRYGMVLLTTAVLIAPGMHAIAKGLSDSLSAGQITWARFAFQLIFMGPLVLIPRHGRLPAPSISHGVRSLLLATAMLAFFWAVTFMPLADATAIFFVEPLILTLLSALFLGERIGWRRVLAVLVGFAGALIVIRPSFEAVGLPALLPLLAAICYALYLIITRSLISVEDGSVLQFWVAVFATLILSVALAVGGHTDLAVLRPAWPTMALWGWLAVLGIIATISHRLAIQAFRLAPAGALAPFQYLEILGATLLGVVVFGDIPDGLMALGIVIIVGSGFYVFHRQRRSSHDHRA